jgi:hypothetical protein
MQKKMYLYSVMKNYGTQQTQMSQNKYGIQTII